MKPITPRAPGSAATPAAQSSAFSLTRTLRGENVTSYSGRNVDSAASSTKATSSATAAREMLTSTPHSTSSGGSARAGPTVSDKLWRSGLVQLEAAMRELVSSGGNDGVPTVERIEQTLQHYDELLQLVSPTVGSILKLFRIEFCRAIFSASPMVTGDLGQVPFFEKIGVMLKECMVLKAEIDAAESDTSVLEMKKQIQKLSSLVPYYEQEVNRLARENKRLFDEVAQAEAELENAAKQHLQAVTSVDDDIRKLTMENRELQLQVFKLGKGTREVSAGQSSYMHLKQQKMELLCQMFDDGNEAATLMLLMHQLDHSINQILDEFDLAFLRAGSREVGSLRIKLSKQVSILLEEFHYLEERYNIITGGALGESSLKASARYDTQVKIIKRETQARRKSVRPKGAPAVTVAGGPAASVREETYDQMVLADEIVKQKKLDWAKNICGASVENRETGQRFNQEHHTWDPLEVFKEAFLSPMLDTSSTKFMCGIDVYAQAGGNQNLVRSVNYVDPTGLIELPQRTTHVRLKYTSAFIKPVTQNIESQPPQQQQIFETVDPNTAVVLDWSPAHRTFAGKNSSGPLDEFSRMDGPMWHAYKACFGRTRPNLPRPIETYQVDFIILQACLKHDQRMQRRYQTCFETATMRSTNPQMTKALAERLFRDEHQFYDFQYSILEVLEARYGFSELVMRTVFEVLYTLEKDVSEHTYLKIYIDAISGVSGTAQAHCIASMMHLVSSYWPLPMSQLDQSISDRDIVSVLRMLYPGDGAVKVNVEEVMADLSVSTNMHFSLRTLRSYIAAAVSVQREPIIRKFNDILMYRTNVVQWAELDFQDLTDSTKSLLPDEAPQAVMLAHYYTVCTVLNKSSRIPPAELAYIAASVVWSSHSKSKN